LWVLPLAIYLFSFVIVFAGSPRRPLRTLAIFPMAILWQTFVFVLHRPIAVVFAFHLLTLFVVCLACHGELARTRPRPAQLTEFFLWLAGGGVLGGLFNALLAPLIFTGLTEYPLALVLACFVVPSDRPAGEAPARLDWHDIWIPLLLFLILSGFSPWIKAMFRDQPTLLRLLGLMFLLYGLPAAVVYLFRDRPVRFGLCVGALLLSARGLGEERQRIAEVYEERSFYGVVRVFDASAADDPDVVFRRFVHGSTLHGLQRRSEDLEIRRQPLSYYFRNGPIGELFASREGRFRRVAVLGLGAGALACYADAGQEWNFYEIDPAVARVAETYFDFLNDARNRGAEATITLGDARFSLEQAPKGKYDLIFADAFSSDSVPVHLLTREALEVYRSRLAPGGVLVLNITNRYLDLEPVLANLAADAEMVGRLSEEVDAEFAQHGADAPRTVSAEEKKQGKAASRWVVLAETEADLGDLANAPHWRPLRRRPASRLWTDDYSNPFVLLRW
jgi:hypothetical protein